MTQAATPQHDPAGDVSFRELFKLFRDEEHNPKGLYQVLGARAANDIVDRIGPIEGMKIGDIGCGPGWYTRALRARGADVIPIDYSADELSAAGDWPEGGIVGDAMALPLQDGSLDGVFASNMLEHVKDAKTVLGEFQRVLKPGGWAYVSWTNWYSPWGAHEMSPYQYFGPKWGPKLYIRRNGPARKHVVGESLFPVHIGPTLKWLEARPGLEVMHVEPRYWPKLRFIVDVPGLRELVTWNCVVWLRKTA